MDGTLIDSTPAVVRSWGRWALERGIGLDQLQGFHGVPAASVVAALVPADQVAEALARVVEIETNDLADITVLPGATAALAELGSRAAIVTSCTRGLAHLRLQAAEVDAPDIVVTVDDVERGKPAPDPFLLAATKLGLDPAECLVVEDAPQGIIAGRAAGCATLAVATTNPADALAHADVVVESLAAVQFQVVDGAVRVERLGR